MAFLTGPRQCGKTTLAEMLRGKGGRYFNWDQTESRVIWTKSPNKLFFSEDGNLPEKFLVLDEVHKARGWKRTLKGMYDTKPHPCQIIVTGSARLNTYKKGGDSLLGRYYPFRLHPFTLGEAAHKQIPSPKSVEEYITDPTLIRDKSKQEIWNRLVVFGGFPEPFLQGSEKMATLWRRNRIELLVREDIRDLTSIRDLSLIEMLVALLPERVGSPFSYQSVREDLEVSFDSVKRWMKVLEETFYHFFVYPWSQSVPRSLKKEPKVYLWDWSEIRDKGPRFENMVACHLKKACDYWTDTGEGSFDLHYLKTKEKREIDFLVSRNKKPWLAVECRSSDLNPSQNFSFFDRHLKSNLMKVQIVDRPDIVEVFQAEKSRIVVVSARELLSRLP